MIKKELRPCFFWCKWSNGGRINGCSVFGCVSLRWQKVGRGNGWIRWNKCLWLYVNILNTNCTTDPGQLQYFFCWQCLAFIYHYSHVKADGSLLYCLVSSDNECLGMYLIQSIYRICITKATTWALVRKKHDKGCVITPKGVVLFSFSHLLTSVHLLTVLVTVAGVGVHTDQRTPWVSLVTRGNSQGWENWWNEGRKGRKVSMDILIHTFLYRH